MCQAQTTKELKHPVGPSCVSWLIWISFALITGVTSTSIQGKPLFVNNHPTKNFSCLRMQSRRQIYSFYNSVNYIKITHFFPVCLVSTKKNNTTCPFLPQTRNISEVNLVNLTEWQKHNRDLSEQKMNFWRQAINTVLPLEGGEANVTVTVSVRTFPPSVVHWSWKKITVLRKS